MKNFMNKIKAKANSLAISAKTTIENVRAEGYVDTGVKIIIAVVVGAVILGDRDLRSGQYHLFQKDGGISEPGGKGGSRGTL